MISAPLVARRIFIKFRTSFIHTHRTAVQHSSIEGGNCALRFRRLRHLNKGHPPGFAGISVHHYADRFDGSVGCKKFPQLLFRHRNIQVSNKYIGHEFFSSRPCSRNPELNAEF